MRDELRGKRVGLVLSGGNTSIAHLAEALAASPGGDTARR
jgi:threonine dehydratase